MLAILAALALAQLSGAPSRSGATSAEAVEADLFASQTGTLLGRRALVINVLARRSQGWGSTTALNDVAQYLDTSQNLMNTPNVAVPYFVRSSSASDIDGGTGARSVRVTFLDVAGVQFTEKLVLDGGWPIALRRGDAGVGFVQWMEVDEIGSNEVSVGNLTVSSNATAATPTVAETVEYIAAGGNRSLSGRYKVPSGFSAYVHSMECSATGGATQDVRLRAQVFEDDHSISQAYHFLDTVFITSSVEASHYQHWTAVPAGAIIKLSSISSGAAAANRLDCGLHFLVRQN